MKKLINKYSWFIVLESLFIIVFSLFSVKHFMDGDWNNFSIDMLIIISGVLLITHELYSKKKGDK